MRQRLIALSRLLIIVLCTLILCLTSLIPLLTLHAADPVTAHVVLPPFTSLDPVSVPKLYSMESGSRTIIENLFVGLTRYNPATHQVEPGIAASWKTDDQLVWTFTLRNDIQWIRYNSQTSAVEAVRPISANDFVYALSRACQPTQPRPVTHTIYIIKGCRVIATADPALVNDLFIGANLGVKALSDTTLEISLAFGAPYFPTLLTLPEFRAVPKEAITKSADWTAADTIMTNGPIALKEWSRDAQTMTLIRNPLWPDPLSGNVEQVMITTGNLETAAQKLISGEADFAPLDASQLGTIRSGKPELVKTGVGHTIMLLGFSAERTWVQKAPFRRALAFAIDRQKLVSQVLLDAALPISRFIPPGSIGSPADPPDNSGFSITAAKDALTAAGLSNCRIGERLIFMIEDDPLAEAVATSLMQQWNDTLGCTLPTFRLVKAKAEDVRAVAHASVDTSSQTADPRPHLWLTTWTPDYPDANGWSGDGLHCQYGYLRTGVPCSDADSALDKAFTEPDAAKRAELYAKAETVWFGSEGLFPIAPLYITLDAVGQQAWLKGATTEEPQRFDLWSIEK